jgi:glycosyltransferase involved in cell wall biosynthesis
MTLHGGALPEFMARYPRWTRRVLSRAARLLTPSEFLARVVARDGWEATVVPNVIELDRYEFRCRQSIRPRLFWMRAFHPIYNPQMAVRVLRRLLDRAPDASLVMAGAQKGIEHDVRRLAADLGVADRVRFPGFLDLDGKVREGAAADVFVNTNRIDNMPVALLEVGAMGLPIVATAVGGVPDLLQNGTRGILVPDDDDEAMAAGVLRLLDDPGLTARLSSEGRQLARRSSWAVVGPQWKQLLEEVVSR